MLAISFCSSILAGVAVGSGLQTKVAVINLICFYGIGLPVGIVLGYVFNLGVQVNLEQDL